MREKTVLNLTFLMYFQLAPCVLTFSEAEQTKMQVNFWPSQKFGYFLAYYIFVIWITLYPTEIKMLAQKACKWKPL